MCIQKMARCTLPFSRAFSFFFLFHFSLCIIITGMKRLFRFRVSTKFRIFSNRLQLKTRQKKKGKTEIRQKNSTHTHTHTQRLPKKKKGGSAQNSANPLLGLQRSSTHTTTRAVSHSPTSLDSAYAKKTADSGNHEKKKKQQRSSTPVKKKERSNRKAKRIKNRK